MEFMRLVTVLTLLISRHCVQCASDPKSFLSNQVPSPFFQELKVNPSDGLALYLPINVDPNSTCGYGIQDMLDGLEEYDGIHPTWTHKIVDSWGKSRGGGLIMGNYLMSGVYDQCIRTFSPTNTVRGKYCVVYLWKYWNKREKKDKDHLTTKNRPHLHQAIGDIIDLPAFEDTIYTTCMPHTCTTEDLRKSMLPFLLQVHAVILDITCYVEEPKPEFTPADIGFIFVLSFLGFLALLASFVDIFIQVTKKKDISKGGLRFLLPFSAYTNLGKLFHLSTEKTTGNITCLHAMRVLSMTWVIYCHQQTVYLDTTQNINFLWSKLFNIIYQVIANGYPSVDTFFFMSGLLVSYNILKELKRTGRFNILLFYLHRLIRLIPPIAILVGFFSTILHFFVSGPITPLWEYFQKTCQLAFWRDLSFVTNIIQEPIEKGLGASCLPQGWYIGADTQLYIIAPLLVLPLFYFRSLGELWLFIVAIVSCVIPAAITYKYDLPPMGLLINPNAADFMSKLYFVPWARAGPYVVGMWFGYLLHKQGNKRIQLQSWQVAGGWTAAVFAGLMVVFKMWDYNVPEPRVWPYDQVTQITYAGFHRSIWGLALGWVVTACHNGYGGLVDSFLSHPMWQPMSRMTFTIYLVAFPIQYAIASCAKLPNYFTHYNKLIETIGALIMSTVVATFVTILVESPVIAMEKLLLRKGHGTDQKYASKETQGIDNKGFSQMNEVELLTDNTQLQEILNLEDCKAPGSAFHNENAANITAIGDLDNLKITKF